MKTELSARLAERLQRVLPGGDTRSATFYPPFPAAFARGEGPYLFDVDGNRYLDFWNNFTSLAHGHAHPAVVRAIAEQAARGTAFPGPHAGQAELAERLQARLPSLELLRFTNSGTEAVMLAVRAARAVTGRDVIIKAEGGYHGFWEQVPMTQAASQLLGIPESVARLTQRCEYNDVASLSAVMSEHGASAAALILEPVMGSGGVIRGEAEFLRTARDLCDRYGALLIFDEVITFRLSPGGQQELLGIRPDLTALGKIIGGGLPVGATGGRAELLAHFDPRRPSSIGHSGTFNGNPLTVAAGIATLDLLDQTAITTINALGARLADGLRACFAAAGVPAAVNHVGSLVQIHLDRVAEVRRFADANPGSALLARLHRCALEQGLLFAGRGLFCTSTVMDEAFVDAGLAAFARALSEALAMGARR